MIVQEDRNLVMASAGMLDLDKNDGLDAAYRAIAGHRPLPLGRYLLLEIKHALAIDLPVKRRVTGRTLFHELGEQSSFVSGHPLGWHMTKNPLANRPSPPIWDHLAGVGLDVFFAEGVAGCSARAASAASVPDSESFWPSV